MLAMKHECIWTNKGDIFYNQIVLMDAFIMNKLQVGTTVYFNGSPPKDPDFKTSLVAKND